MKRGILVAMLVIVIFIIFILLVGGFIYLQFNQEPHIPDNAYLKIHISGKIVDHEDSVMPKSLTIRDLFYHLQRAKIDKRIQGVFLKISCVHASFSTIEDLGLLVKDFRSSGKEVVAYLECGDLRDFYLGTFADKFYVFKGGDLFLRGLASEAIFLKNTLGKLGIQAEMLQIGDYKTAMNMFTEDGMTPPHRESLQGLLDDIYQSTLDGIARNRRVELPALKDLIDESPISNETYLKAGLIDGEAYEDEILNREGDKQKTVKFSTYVKTTSPKPYTGTKKIALIFANGEIHLGKSGEGSIYNGRILGSDTLVAQLSRVRKSSSVKAVVLRLNSPGGSAMASEVIRREIERLAEKKPVVVSMSTYAASGGYWIAAAASKIFALPQTITGSIGVIGGKFVLKDLYNSVGLKKEILKTTQYADMFTDYRVFSPGEREKLFRLMNKLYRTFINIVSEQRNLKLEEVEVVAQGRVWSGSHAHKINLVDSQGGLLDALSEAKRMAEIPTDEKVGIRIYPKQKTLLDMISQLIGIRATELNPVSQLQATIGLYEDFFPALLLPYKIKFF